MIPVLCVDRDSNYKRIALADCYDVDRDARTFKGGRCIAHPPCAQWSKMRGFSKPDVEQKELGIFCLEMVKKYGGVLEQPVGSGLFAACGVKPTHQVDQNWFGFPATKPTWLFVKDVMLQPIPLHSWAVAIRRVADLHSSMRSRMTMEMCSWLLRSVEVPAVSGFDCDENGLY